MLKISSRIRLLGLAAVTAAVLVSASASAHAQAIRTAAPHQHGPASIRHVHDGTSDSDNWAGYAIAGATSSSAASVSVTFVSGSWKVPEVTCSSGKRSSAEYASFWVGIDGWYSGTVEQLGTDSDCSNGKPSYYAWYEFYPEAAYYAGELTDLSPGDHMSATVTYNANGSFTAMITDVSNSSLKPFTTTFTPTHQTGTPQRSSAEWITEQTGKLADFGTVFFGDGYVADVPYTCFATATVNGNPYKDVAIGSFPSTNVWSSTMVQRNGTPMATPSALISGEEGSGSLSSFYVDWNSVGP